MVKGEPDDLTDNSKWNEYQKNLKLGDFQESDHPSVKHESLSLDFLTDSVAGSVAAPVLKMREGFGID